MVVLLVTVRSVMNAVAAVRRLEKKLVEVLKSKNAFTEKKLVEVALVEVLLVEVREENVPVAAPKRSVEKLVA